MKRKAKAIHAELRKESKSFDGWLKYEITIQYPNGKTEQVPAYGKDLQDALSRVAHDKKVEKLSKTKVPVLVGISIGALSAIAFTLIGVNLHRLDSAAGPTIIGTMTILTALTLSIVNWFNLRSREK